MVGIAVVTEEVDIAAVVRIVAVDPPQRTDLLIHHGSALRTVWLRLEPRGDTP